MDNSLDHTHMSCIDLVRLYRESNCISTLVMIEVEYGSRLLSLFLLKMLNSG